MGKQSTFREDYREAFRLLNLFKKTLPCDYRPFVLCDWLCLWPKALSWSRAFS